jgi:hypothetical protein
VKNSSAKKTKVKPKSVDEKDTREYKAGKRDAENLTARYSLFLACAMIRGLGLTRKSKESNKHLRRYCNGVNDVLEEQAKERGIDFKDCSVLQEDIGK